MSINNIIEKYKDLFNIKFNQDKNELIYSTKKNLNNTQGKKNSKLWGKVFDLHYKDFTDNKESTTDTAIWKNSYDNSQIPQEEMNEWISTTTTRINKFINPSSSVLEVGCGNGLIYEQIIDDIEYYTGIDPSVEAIEGIASSSTGIRNKDKTSLYSLEALDVDQISGEVRYDIIIVNSVIQYFSSSEYLYSFIEKLDHLLTDNGVIFVGDIRSFDLRKVYYLDVCKFRNIESEYLNSEIAKLELLEKETLISPDFFHFLKTRINWVQDITIDIRAGKYLNEMTKFRYDAILFKKSLPEKELITINRSIQFPELLDQARSLSDDKCIKIENIDNNRILSLIDETVTNNTNLDISNLFNLEENSNLNIQIDYGNNESSLTVYISKYSYCKTETYSNHKLFSNHLVEKNTKSEKQFFKEIKDLDNSISIKKEPFYFSN